MHPPTALSFGLIASLDAELLVTDRVLQRDIHYTLVSSVRSASQATDTRPYNPTPLVILQRDGALAVHGLTFQINEPGTIYFFDRFWPTLLPTEQDFQETSLSSGIPVTDFRGYSAICKELGLSEEVAEHLLYQGDRTLLDRLGETDMPFTKSLQRVRGWNHPPEHYCSRSSCWTPHLSQQYLAVSHNNL